MFTGLIEEVGQVERIEKAGESARLTVEAPRMAPALEVGESVAVDGTCLTVEILTGTGFVAFASAETLKRTTLSAMSAGRKVNLERALRLGDRLGGHLVQGHVDATGGLRGLEPFEGGWVLSVEAPREILDVSVPKGSIAVDGISLTLVDLTADGFTVSMIPETYRATALQYKRTGDRVNLESDLMGKYVARCLGAYGVNLETNGGPRVPQPATALELLLRRRS
ncbi:MAG TPA: riboflavin synthase [Candidatus Sumerlaeota bacterium]|nr:riboflavin synthase [Candidatus Sumerlaeota bacterium]